MLPSDVDEFMGQQQAQFGFIFKPAEKPGVKVDRTVGERRGIERRVADLDHPRHYALRRLGGHQNGQDLSDELLQLRIPVRRAAPSDGALLHAGFEAQELRQAFDTGFIPGDQCSRAAAAQAQE
jgi:hypothetical protein